MKKALLGVMALGILFAASCKKSDDSSSSSNTWKVGGTTHTASVVTKSSQFGQNIFLATEATGGSSANNISFFFSALPTTSGSYKVIANTATVGANEVSFVVTSAAGGTATSYQSTGNDNINASITVNGGKVTVNLPDATALNAMTGTDSAKVSANLTEQ